MPTRRTVLAAAATTLAAVGCGMRPAGPVAGLAAPIADRLRAVIARAMDDTAIPGALVGVWSPDGDYTAAFGVADTATGAPMHTGLYSRIGSVTKTFTGTALLQLVDRGLVGLDDPVSRHLDGIRDGTTITVRQLATIRSGLVDYSHTGAFAGAVAADPARGGDDLHCSSIPTSPPPTAACRAARSPGR